MCSHQTWKREGGNVEGLISPWHLAILAVILLLVFGPKRLPELGQAVGKTITGFKQGLSEAQEEIRGTHEQTVAPAAAPVQATSSMATLGAVESGEQLAPAPSLTVVDGGDALSGDTQ